VDFFALAFLFGALFFFAADFPADPAFFDRPFVRPREAVFFAPRFVGFFFFVAIIPSSAVINPINDRCPTGATI